MNKSLFGAQPLPLILLNLLTNCLHVTVISTRKVGGPRFLGTLPKNLGTLVWFLGRVPRNLTPLKNIF